MLASGRADWDATRDRLIVDDAVNGSSGPDGRANRLCSGSGGLAAQEGGQALERDELLRRGIEVP